MPMGEAAETSFPGDVNVCWCRVQGPEGKARVDPASALKASTTPSGLTPPRFFRHCVALDVTEPHPLIGRTPAVIPIIQVPAFRYREETGHLQDAMGSSTLWLLRATSEVVAQSLLDSLSLRVFHE